MATQAQKALSLPAVQSAIKSRASALARTRIKDEVGKAKDKFKKMAPMIRKDFIESHAVPVGVGAVAAVGFDVLLNKVGGAKIGGGARGDIVKTVIAVGAGYGLRKVVKTPYVAHAAVGVGTVNLYKLLSRIGNRAAAGTLSGLLSESHDMDLAGYPEALPMYDGGVSGYDELSGGYSLPMAPSSLSIG